METPSESVRPRGPSGGGAPSPAPDRPPSGLDGVASRLLGGPLAAALVALCLVQLATWIPPYLTWNWGGDTDDVATMALAWDAGKLPYRDMLSFQFPGEIYLCWLVGKAFGWGRTAPLYAADAALVVGLGAATVAWSRARFGRSLPGAVGYASFLSWYLGQTVGMVAQRDLHAAEFAALALFALEAWPGRRGRLASALAMAAAVVFRPHVAVFGPAVLLALDGNGLGFTIALLLMGIPREVLGNGTFLGFHVMPHAFEPWVIMLLPPGGFFMIGVLLLVANWHDLRVRARAEVATTVPATIPVAVTPEPEAVVA